MVNDEENVRRDFRNLNPQSVGLLTLIREDFRTHNCDPVSQGFWALAVYRLSNQIKTVRPLWLMRGLFFCCKVCNRVVEWLTGITLLHTTIIGRRLRIWHHSGIIVNANSIGDDVVLRQNTTIGEARPGGGLPTIGSGVDIGCGAAIIGKVVVGDHARIGANSVVVGDVPAGLTAAGVPAKILISVSPV